MSRSILIKSCKIIDPNSSFNQQVIDVLIEDGKISKIGKNLSFDGNHIDGSGKFLAPGFFDMNVSFGEPGLETR
jgi:dihydroorotase